ncbi:hypothetical protein A2872_00950 [Candidatus Gottesmanbacteria bacterium RIFCSPHIGHO2_01_FULL_42_12]|uniref:Bacterial Ig-like domain-containing protein n=1 Tax=Candidatus Gottesmanbacteria bacterium RIFCSPHIGHO2_01_FULL_42_12 TaxID=1798377 RepID=A0A1F5Z385_9BACT|nr:MAG: hypothetical protein A2872_00950 [Candidatus Gottesmanbacteria bacterium RIFCSPHIGHO2_01_FULL_42_12]
MTVPKNVFLALIVVITVALISVMVYLLLRPKTVVAPAEINPSETTRVISPTPTPAMVAKKETFERQIKLIVSSPSDGSTVKTNKLSVKGVTMPLAEVFVNDLELKADTLGNFSGTLTLEEGDNPISIIAIDENGNYSEMELTITYEP